MVHIAHEEGFAVMSHTNGVYGVQAAIEAGVDSLEHGNYMDEECISMLADSRTVWVPTLVTVRNLRGCGRYEDRVLMPIIRKAEENLFLAFQKKGAGGSGKRRRRLHGNAWKRNCWMSILPFGQFWETADNLENWPRQGEMK